MPQAQSRWLSETLNYSSYTYSLLKLGHFTAVTAGLAKSNGSLLPGLWHDSLHVTCGLTAGTPGSAPRPTFGNEYGITLPFLRVAKFLTPWQFSFWRKTRRFHSDTEAAGQWNNIFAISKYQRNPHKYSRQISSCDIPGRHHDGESNRIKIKKINNLIREHSYNNNNNNNNNLIHIAPLPSVLWRCWLGGRKGIRPVKNEWWGAGVVVCLQQDADLHMAQLMPLPLIVSCSTKIQIGFTFLVSAHLGSPGKRAIKWVCVCVSYSASGRKLQKRCQQVTAN